MSTHGDLREGSGAHAVLGAQTVRAVIAARARHWQRARRLSTLLLLLWLGTTCGTVFFARELAAVTVFGWPLSFYLAAQGAALIYLAILGIYALAMTRLDRRYAAELARAAAQQARGETP